MAQVVMTIDRNAGHTSSLEAHIRQEMAMGTVCKHSAADALRHVISGAEPQPDVVLMEVGTDTSTVEVLRALRSLRPDMQVLLLASHATVDAALDYLAEGASDFLLMPFHPAQLTAAIRNALIRRDLQVAARHAWTREPVSLEEFTPASAALEATLYLARKFADTDAPLILEGAPGTGRELFARAIHGSSGRADAPFLAVNASAYLEGEAMKALFGSEGKRGILARVGHGSLLLRNADSLPLPVCHRLLAVLRGDEPLHPSRPQERFNGRMMFAVQDATRSTTDEAVQEGIARMFSQLNALPLRVPYLRDMPEDIPFFSMQLCRRYAALEGKPVLGISPPALQMLREISWPGNMEQLALGIFNAVMCCQSHELQIGDFRYLFRPQSASVSPLPVEGRGGMAAMGDDERREGLLRCLDRQGNVKRLQDVEQELIRYALERYSGHMSAVARHLGIGRSTLYRKISTMDGK